MNPSKKKVFISSLQAEQLKSPNSEEEFSLMLNKKNIALTDIDYELEQSSQIYQDNYSTLQSSVKCSLTINLNSNLNAKEFSLLNDIIQLAKNVS